VGENPEIQLKGLPITMEFYEILVRCNEHKNAWIMANYVRFLRDSERIIAEMSASQNI
jgi:hypothetical protein